MNLLHMKYALVVAEKHSINKAAQQLIVGAPALSRAVKELENSLGVILFERSVKGMTLTPDGELFVMYAKKALKQINDIENIFRNGPTGKQHFFHIRSALELHILRLCGVLEKARSRGEYRGFL